MGRRTLSCALLAASLLATAAPAIAQEAGGGAVRRRRTTRIDFDERLVEGQTKKAEALYLFERKDSKIRSLVKRRKSFRKEIIRKIDE